MDYEVIKQFQQQFEEYFTGFFEDLTFREQYHNELGQCIAISADYSGYTFEFSYSSNFLIDKKIGDSFYHFLENVKGEIVRSGEKLLLTKKAAN